MALYHGSYKKKQRFSQFLKVVLRKCSKTILFFFSKILERLMDNRVIKFINKHDMLYKYQFGFKKGHSTYMPLTICHELPGEANRTSKRGDMRNREYMEAINEQPLQRRSNYPHSLTHSSGVILGLPTLLHFFLSLGMVIASL